MAMNKLKLKMQLVAEVIRSDVMTLHCMLDYEDKKKSRPQSGQP